jgi:hypothetical protein
MRLEELTLAHHNSRQTQPFGLVRGGGEPCVNCAILLKAPFTPCGMPANRFAGPELSESVQKLEKLLDTSGRVEMAHRSADSDKVFDCLVDSVTLSATGTRRR